MAVGAEDTTDVFQASLPAQNVSFTFSTSGWLDHIAGIVRNEGLAVYEAPFPELICSLLRQTNGLVLDVGANTGLFSLLAAACNPHLKVCSFEPLPSIADKLKRNISLNKELSPRIQTYQVGLSNAVGSFDFYEHLNQYGLVSTSSSLEISHTEAVGTDHVKTTILTDTLDNICDRLNKNIDFLKIDVEGHEYAVIEGGRSAIRRFRPLMSVEVLEPSEIDPIRRMIFEENYVDFVIAPQTLRVCESLRFHADGWNHLLCPMDKIELVFQTCRQIGLNISFA